MPVLRLFAAAREAAGTASAEVPGVTVDEVLDAARARFGPELASVIASSKVWRNGEPASGDDPVGPGDEVAVLPPVSGGSGPDGPSGGRSRRPTFAPAEPPPPPTPRPGPRRSPSAEAAAARRIDQADRAADAHQGSNGGRAIRPRPVDPSTDGARRGLAPDGAGRRSTGRPGPAPGDGAGRTRRPAPDDGRGRPGRRTSGAPSGRRPDSDAGRTQDGAGRGASDRRRDGGRPPGRTDGRSAAASGRGRDGGRPGPTADGVDRRTGDRRGRTPAGPGRAGPRTASGASGRSRAGGPVAARPAGRGAAGPGRGPGRGAAGPGRGSAGPGPRTGAAGDGPRPDPATRRRPPSTPPPLQPGELTRTTAPTGRPLAPPAAEADADPTRTTGRLTRMHSVGVPVTGSITVRGRERKVSGMRARRTALGRRYGVVYDTDGPKVTLGVGWFIAVMGSIALGWWALTFLFAIAAGWAAMEAADRWREQGVAADPWVAALGAGAVGAAGAAGTGWMGGAILLVVAASITRMALSAIGRDHVLSAAGNTVGCAIPFGLASGAVVLANDLEIGAVVALLLFVAAYDAGDFLIGSGSSNSVEGPLTGIVTIGVVAMAIAVLGTPPFEGVPTYTFAAFAAVLCPLGQLAASAILPANDAHAPSVRRLDSLLLLAPIWVWTVGIFMDGR